jgi:hypothetical protein
MMIRLHLPQVDALGRVGSSWAELVMGRVRWREWFIRTAVVGGSLSWPWLWNYRNLGILIFLILWFCDCVKSYVHCIHSVHIHKCLNGRPTAWYKTVVSNAWCPRLGDLDSKHQQHSTRPSSVVLRESPEAVREFPSELGIARTTDLTVWRVPP